MITRHEGDALILWCPGCDGVHRVTIGPWSWNGDVDRPTVSPSLLVTGVQWAADEPFHKPKHSGGRGDPTRCHSFIVDGRWQYLTDSTHTLAGQTVPMVPLPDLTE